MKIFKIFFFLLLVPFYKSQMIYSADFSTYNLGILGGQNDWLEKTCYKNNCQRTQVTNFSMSSLGYSTTDKSVYLNTHDNTPYIQFPNSTSTTAGSYYISFLININSVNLGDAITTYDFMKINSGNDFIFRIMAFAVDANTYKIRFGKMNTEVCPTLLNFNQTYLLIFKYTQNSSSLSDDTVSIFVNPIVNGNEPTPILVTNTDNDGSANLSINMITIDQSMSEYNNFTGYLSQLKVFRNWSDINTSNLNASEIKSNNEVTLTETLVNSKISFTNNQLLNNNDSIEIIDNSGRIIKRVNYQNTISIQELSSGLYYLNIIKNHKIYRKLKFIKK